MRILVKTPMDMMSGYGSDGTGIVRALSRLGHDVRVFPVSVTPPMPLEALELLTKPLDPPYELMLVHVDPMSLTASREDTNLAERVVGWSMWEWEEFLPPKGMPAGPQFKRRNKGLDAFVSYDQVTATAMKPWLRKRTKHYTLQGGFWSEDWQFMEDRDWDAEPFRFVMVGQLHERKNPSAALQAFAHLKKVYGDDFNAELHLKTVPGSGVLLDEVWEEAFPWLRIYRRYWDHEQMLRFYRRAHCLLAPSTGEGKNLPALEMQSTGGVVIATAYSGHTTWLSSAYAYPLGYERKKTWKGVAAMADLQELADLMWHVYTHREEAQEKGVLASKTVQARFDWVPVMARFIDLVEEVPRRDITFDFSP